MGNLASPSLDLLILLEMFRSPPSWTTVWASLLLQPSLPLVWPRSFFSEELPRLLLCLLDNTLEVLKTFLLDTTAPPEPSPEDTLIKSKTLKPVTVPLMLKSRTDVLTFLINRPSKWACREFW